MRRTGAFILALLGLWLALVPLAAAAPQIEKLVELPAAHAVHSVAIDPDGNLYLGESDGLDRAYIYVYSPSGDQRDRLTVTAGSTGVVALRGLAFDRSGNLYVADAADGDEGDGRILKITSRGRQSVVARRLTEPVGLAIDRDDVLYVADGREGQILWIGPDGASAVFAEDDRLQPHSRAGLGASGLAFSPNGRQLYISNAADDRVFRLSIDSDGSAGRLSVLADRDDFRRDGQASGVLHGPEGLAVDRSGNLLVAAGRSHEVDYLSPDGKLLARLQGDGDDALSTPTGLALGSRYGFIANLAAERGRSHLSRFALADLPDSGD